LKSAGLSFASMNDEAQMSNDEGMTKFQLRGYWFSFSNSSLETTLLLKLCFFSSAMFVFLPSLALHVRLCPIGREDEMERRVNARGRSLDNAKQLPLKETAGSFSLGREG